MGSTKPRATPKHLDDFITFGKYTVMVCIMAELVILAELGNTVYMVYAGAAPQIVGCGNRTFEASEGCKLLTKCAENEKAVVNYQFYSINIEWDYLCSATNIVKSSTSLQMLGVVIGSVIAGQVSDSFGRKWPMVICLILCTVLGYATVFAQSIFQFTVLRFAIGLFNGGHTTIITVYLIENISKKSRMFINTVISWSPNMILLGAITYFFQDWKSLVIAISTLTIPAIMMMIFLHESPRWLVQKGRTEEAGKIIKSIRKFNGDDSSFDDILDRVLEGECKTFQETAQKKYTFYHIFSRRNMTIACLVISFSYLSTSIVNYAFLFNLESLSGSIYLNSMLMGGFRWAVNLLCGIMDHRILCFGRKLSHFLCLAFVLLSIGSSIGVIYTGQETSLKELIRAAVLCVCSMCSQIYIIDGIACNELFPTSIRTLCFAFVQIFSRGGIVVAPYVFSLTEYGVLIPYFILFSLAALDTVLFQFLLPESKNAPLLDHIAPKKNRSKSDVEEMQEMISKTL